MTTLLRRLLPILAATPLAAQAPATSIPDMQVTATRGAAALRTVPASVTVIEGEELRARGLTYLLDVLAGVPGATVAQAGSYGAQASLFLRGGESDHAKVLVDGVTMNNPGGLFDFGSLSLENVDRIEIVRGPVSVLYGADAMSGVVQVFTRRGAGGMSGEIEATGGTFGRQDVRGRLAGAGPGFHGSAAFSRFASDGIHDLNNEFADINATVRGGIDGGSRGSVDLTVRYGDALHHYPTDGNGAPVDANQRQRDEDVAARLVAARPLGHGAELSLEAWTHVLRTAARDEQDHAADTTGFALAGTRDAVLSRRGIGLRADWRPAAVLRLSGGVGVEQEEEDQTSVTRSNFGFGISDDSAAFRADRVTRHAWVQALASVHPTWHLQLGARLDDNSAFGSFATGRAGVTWEATSAVRLWTAVGTGFKGPTFSELFAASPFEVGNPALDPESSTNVEAGVEVGAGGVRVAVTAFRQSMRDLIQYVAAAPGEPTYANLQAARSRGVEATLTVSPNPRLSARAHVTLLRTEVTDTGATASVVFTQGEPLLRRPATQAGVTVIARPGALVTSLAARWVGKREDADFRDFPAQRITLPSYGLVDAAVELPLGIATGVGATLIGRVENLFDAEYQQVFGFTGRGRTLHAGARLTF